jgi:hypothetical protein
MRSGRLKEKGWGNVRGGEEVGVGKKRARASSTTTDISGAATVTVLDTHSNSAQGSHHLHTTTPQTLNAPVASQLTIQSTPEPTVSHAVAYTPITTGTSKPTLHTSHKQKRTKTHRRILHTT